MLTVVAGAGAGERTNVDLIHIVWLGESGKVREVGLRGSWDENAGRGCPRAQTPTLLGLFVCFLVDGKAENCAMGM